MANYRTAEEARKAYIECMGQQLGEQFHELWQELAWLYAKWAEYVELFGTRSSRIDLLNQAAPHFFKIVQDSLWEDVILHIARLTDPPRSSGKENLTIQALPELIDDEATREKVRTLVSEAVETSDFCRDWRNRRIAHKDLKLALEDGVQPLKAASRERVRKALEAVSDVLNGITSHYSSSETVFETPAAPGGALTLLYRIDDGLRIEGERRERLKKGEPEEGDLGPRDI
ncbi:hypothetical protein SAMN05216429_10956 [Marinobacter persicus]|uniref:HEPN AbiU2-like domain-containing protein n=1 Tax=Marinobacter persicus TaxID=930118 RepID=A0A1I3W6D3_9GAMM|nr:hypothetical protein [Marinobacter persicus]GHD46910.1 hypothetical protein GCM10008110_14130 [Marinobacter persicus]SFK03194.1 hypothetical protein SAMN05216429_10956 [Marinobacter persicus]